MKLPEEPTKKVRKILATVLQCQGYKIDEEGLYEIKKLCDVLDITISTMKLHAGDCCSLNNEVDLFRGHWEDAERSCKLAEQRCTELERENRSLKIWLDQYEADSTALIEEHGADPSDKIDREVLKRMLNCLIGKNRKLINKNKELRWRLEGLE